MKNRKPVAFILTLSLVLSCFSVSFAVTESTTANTNPVTFTDVTDHWATAAISKWSGYGIINGYEGKFRPDDSITRGEMAVILDNMMDYQEVAINTFADLQAGQFYTEAVLKANAAGILKGDGVIVRPNDKITKEEAAIMMSRAFAVAKASSTKDFLDASTVSDWAKSAVFGMEAKGYISGFGGYFNPKANITRAEAVTMINNIVKAYYTVAGTYTDNVEGTAIIKVPDVRLKGVNVSENLIIAEGVGQGDATLDSVTVKGETVIRGGGENSVHIIGNSVITKVTIQKVGDKLRVVIDDGITVNDVEVAAGEEIIITGSVGTVELNAPNATVYANAAEIKTATITGNNSTIVVGAKSTLDTVNVSSTAENTSIKTEAGAVIKAITASADVDVSGTGTVSKVTLQEGADGSSVTTPNTSTTVPTGVTGVTGGGGTSIPAGSSGTNNSAGNGATVATSTTTSSSSSGHSSGSSSVAVTGITVTGTGNATTVESGSTLQMVATIAPSNASDQTVTWSASTAGGVATINSSTGLLTAVTVGSVTVTAENVASGISGTAVITVTIPKIQLTAAAPTLGLVKAYNGTTAAAVTKGALSGVTGGDSVTLNATASYNSAAVGTSKTITVVYSITGVDASKYNKPVDYTVSTGEITKAALTIASPTLAISKAYDGTTTSAVTAGALIGIVGSETVSVSATAYYDSAAIATGKTITVAYTISGANAGNYTAPGNYTTTSGIITSAPLGISVPTLTLAKLYNGTTSAAVTAGALSGVGSGDTVTVSAIAYYNTKSVGTGKTITVVYTLGGTDAASYTAPVNYTSTGGSITAATLTITDPTLVAYKAYDGTTATAVTTGSLSGVIGSDVATANAIAHYDTSAIGTSKTITVDYSLSGADAGNYTAPAQYTTTSGIITKAALTITGTNVLTTKSYDGTTVAAVTAGALNGVVSGENVSPVAIAYYDSAAIGSSKTITIVYTLSGTHAGNYIAPIATTTAGIISAAALGISAPTLVTVKTYDGTTAAAVTAGSLIGVNGTDQVTVSAIAYYNDKAVGTGKTITVVYTLGGADAATYTKPSNYTTSAGIITAASLTIADPTLALEKTYNGTTAAAVTVGALSGAVGGDSVTASAAGYYATPDVGTTKTIIVDYTLGGTDAGNYNALVPYTTSSGIVTKAALTIGIPTLAISKAYDGTTAAAVTAGALIGIASGESVTVSAIAYYEADANMGTGKTIVVVYTIGGTDVGNYIGPDNYTTTSGIITAAGLTISTPTLALQKIYDGTTTAAVTAGALSGVSGGDTVTVSAIAYYSDKTVGTGKAIIVEYTIGGANADKYTTPTPYTTTAGIITAASLTIADPTLMLEKAYDGTTAAAVTAGALSGVIGTDAVTVGAIATYNTAAIETGKAITVNYVLGGADSANYISPVSYTTSAGIITVAGLTIGNPTLALVKPYDGTNIAVVTAGALSGVAVGDTVTVSAIASYDNQTIGTDKTITVVYTLGGVDAGKYASLANYTTSAGIITAAALEAVGTVVALTKTYDQTTSAAVTIGAINGIVGSEDVTVSAIAYYADKAAGTGKMITVVYTLGGADASKYAAPILSTTTGSITAASLTIGDPELATSKNYDGTTSTTATAGALTGVLPGDTVSADATANYDTASVGTGKTITVSYTLSGADLGNYLTPNDYTTTSGIILGAATTPSVITLGTATLNSAVINANVSIPAPGATNSTGSVTGWVSGSSDAITFTVTDAGSATSDITINGVGYTSGDDYTIAAAGTLTIVVTTTEAGAYTCVRTFTVNVVAAANLNTVTYDNGLLENDFDDTLTLTFDSNITGIGTASSYQIKYSEIVAFSGEECTLNAGSDYTVADGAGNTVVITFTPTGFAAIDAYVSGLGGGTWQGYFKVTIPTITDLTPLINNANKTATTVLSDLNAANL